MSELDDALIAQPIGPLTRYAVYGVLGHASRLELVTPDGEVRAFWFTGPVGRDLWGSMVHVDRRTDLRLRLAAGTFSAS